MPIEKKPKRKSPVIVFLILTLVFISSTGYLQGETFPLKNKLNLNYLKQFGRDAVSVVSSPLHWKGRNFFTLAAVVGTGALCFLTDQNIKRWVDSNNAGIFDDIWESITNTGNGVFLGGLLASHYIVGEIFKLDNMRKIALLGVESFVISGVLVGLLKYSIGRARPYTGESRASFHPFSSASSYYSFPSGHATSAFSVATVIAEHSKEFLVDLAAYGMATLVAMSRIQKNKHWVSDVFIGSVLGFLIGKKISDLNRGDKAEGLNIGIQLGLQKQAFSLRYSF
ncbi:MAG: phosphatase PAP2 family protein [Candidatus Aminicenantes bacterium]|nr:phosphatase PAP2 family protein [Candidatus Aminicenantes bacterium]